MGQYLGGSVRNYYDRDEHGPTQKVSLNRRYCQLAGGYILCPILSIVDDGFDCRQFPGQLGKSVQNSLTGLLGTRRPVLVPTRAEACKEAGSYVTLLVGRSGQAESTEGYPEPEPPADP